MFCVRHHLTYRTSQEARDPDERDDAVTDLENHPPLQGEALAISPDRPLLSLRLTVLEKLMPVPFAMQDEQMDRHRVMTPVETRTAWPPTRT